MPKNYAISKWDPAPSTKNELQIYLEEPKVTLKGDLMYWKTNESRFPVLAQMARNYLGIQGTNRDVEGTFNKGIFWFNLVKKNGSLLSSSFNWGKHKGTNACKFRLR